MMIEATTGVQLMEAVDHPQIAGTDENGVRSGYEYLTADQLILEKFQRVLNLKWIRDRKGALDVTRLGLIDVAVTETGEYSVVDGQHRIYLIKQEGFDQPLLCHVTHGLNFAERAARFHRLNTERKQPNAVELFWAAIYANSDMHLDILRIWESKGLGVLHHATGASGRMTAAVGALISVYEMDGGVTFERVADAIAKGLPGQPISAKIIRALASFIGQYRDGYNHQRLIDILLGMSARTIEVGVDSARDLQRQSGMNYVGDGIFFVKAYNSGLRTRKLPEWVPGKSSRAPMGRTKNVTAES